MTARILVAFATRNGSTAEIAYAIGKDLQSAGATVTIADMKTVLSLEGYTAAVIGAPLYMGRLPGEVQNFVKQFNENLAKLPVAAFAVGFAPLSKEAGAVEEAMKILKNSLAPLDPVASTLFAGKLDEKKLNLVTRKFLEMAKIPPGDFRDWNAIAAWTRELPEKMGV